MAASALSQGGNLDSTFGKNGFKKSPIDFLKISDRFIKSTCF
jgi:hypothetical protein